MEHTFSLEDLDFLSTYKPKKPKVSFSLPRFVDFVKFAKKPIHNFYFLLTHNYEFFPPKQTARYYKIFLLRLITK